MYKRSKIVIIILIMNLGIWNALSESKASNFLMKDELKRIEKEISGYKKWIKVNPKPYRVNFVIDGADNWDVSPVIGDDGKMLAEVDQNELKGKIKPAETETYGNVYVNDVAATVFQQNSFFLSTLVNGQQKIVFPSNSIIVREKLVKDFSTNSFDVRSLAVMIKSDTSFNSKPNRWQFFYLDPNSFSITKNDQSLCLSCHASKQDNDFVFRSYLPKE